MLGVTLSYILQTMKTTRHDLEKMNPADFAQLKDAFHKTSDGLFALQDCKHLLQPEEVEAINRMRSILLDKLDGLEAAGI